MTFKKGNIPWNKGRPWTDAEREKISLGIREPPEPRLCACGCGQLTKPGNKWIHGHNVRVKNPVDNPKVRQKIAKSWFREGEHTSAETEFKKGNIPWWVKRGLSSPLSNPEIRNNVFPSKDTSIEIMMQEALNEKGLPFETQYPVIGQPDIAFPEEKVAIFCDGCYWHNCPICNKDPNSRYDEGRDEKVTKELEDLGWKVLRFWGHEIKGDVGVCVDRIKQVM